MTIRIKSAPPIKPGPSTRKFDFLWAFTLFAMIGLLMVPAGYQLFVQLSKSHIYLMAFAKFAILATMGELLATRILKGYWNKPTGTLLRSVVWGFLGMLIALVFYLYATGVAGAFANGLLPFPGEGKVTAQLVHAIVTSILMNLLFAPTFMAFHRITDTYIDLGKGNLQAIFQVRLSDVLDQIDWKGFISFVVCKTIPFFWIPAHTITFLLPLEQRVLAAAFLSIALGAILAIAKRSPAESEPQATASLMGLEKH